MNYQHRTFAISCSVVASAISLFLSGCGGGGSAGNTFTSIPLATPTPTGTPSTTPPPPPAAGTAFTMMPPSGSTLVAYGATPPPIAYVDYTAPGNGYGIATSADGTAYITQTGSSTIVKISGGTPTTISLPTNYGAPGYIVRGSDGAMWFSDQAASRQVNSIGRLDSSGTITEYDLPWMTSSEPFGMVKGPDGNVWFAEFYEGRIGRITPQGTFADYSLGTGTHRPSGIAVGSDANLWVAESAGLTMERVSTNGDLLNTYNLGGLSFRAVTGPDGAVWYVDTSNTIGRVDVNGNIQKWILPCNVPNVGYFCGGGYFQGDTDIVLGPDGALWFTAQNFQAIGRLAPPGVLMEWPVPPGAIGLTSPFSMTVSGNSILFAGGGNRMGRITP